MFSGYHVNLVGSWILKASLILHHSLGDTECCHRAHKKARATIMVSIKSYCYFGSLHYELLPSFLSYDLHT